MNRAPKSNGILDDILWPIEKVADYWGVSTSRARALLASRGIKRVSAYPAGQVRSVVRRQGARTDLEPRSAPQEPGRIEGGGELSPVSTTVLRCLADGEVWTPTRIAVASDPIKDSEASTAAGRVLTVVGLGYLQRAGFAENVNEDGWRITDAGRDKHRSLPPLRPCPARQMG